MKIFWASVYEANMNDLFGKLYNGFLLRDLLGYVVPGGLVLICLTHLVSLLKKISVSELITSIPYESTVTFFLICLCYGCGHFISGLFFHTPIFRKFFKYSPDLSYSYPGLSKNKAWAKHRSEYRRSCKVIGESMQSQIERHAALVHFTGHISASLIFTFLYIVFWSFYELSFNPMYYAIPIAIIFPGIFFHFRQMADERYQLEITAIEIAKEIRLSPSNK